MVVDSTIPLTLLLTGGSLAVALGHLLPGHLARFSRPTARPILAAGVGLLRCRHVELIDEPSLRAVGRP